MGAQQDITALTQHKTLSHVLREHIASNILHNVYNAQLDITVLAIIKNL